MPRSRAARTSGQALASCIALLGVEPPVKVFVHRTGYRRRAISYKKKWRSLSQKRYSAPAAIRNDESSFGFLCKTGRSLVRGEPLADSNDIARVGGRGFANVALPIRPSFRRTAESNQEITEVVERLVIAGIERNGLLPMRDRRVVLAALGRDDAEAVVRARRRRIDAQRFVQRRFGLVLFAGHHVHGADVDERKRVRRVERSSALERRERVLHAPARRERD